MARTVCVFFKTRHAFCALIEPMLLWSSWFAEVGMESTLAGCASTLFSDTREAAVYCAIIRPEFNPPLDVRKRGKPLSEPFTNRSMRRSEIFASSDNAMARKSIASAIG